eukprot:13136514-Alexandrium_andersonii.AAC.1
MSASLVGSEMCIRDRGDSDADIHFDRLDRIARAAAHGAPATAAAGGAPVSYTHLTLPTICSV